MVAHLRDRSRGLRAQGLTGRLVGIAVVHRAIAARVTALGIAIVVFAAAAPVASAMAIAPSAQERAAVATSSDVSSGQAIVNAAAAQVGLPYCDGGGSITGPTHGNGGAGCAGTAVGFDCTTLSMYAVYQATGMVLSNDGRQATEGGQIITNEADLQPGDLVFFGGTLDNFSHAGVYAGGGNVWDALDYNYPVQLHTLAQIENYPGDYFVGGARYWSSSGGGGFSEGTFVSYQGSVYRIAGGAPLYVSNWTAVGGPRPTVALSAAQWSALNAVPGNGTFINTSTGHVYMVAGGAPFAVSNWNVFGGQQLYVTVDQWNIDNLGNPATHLSAKPADGTMVQGLPSKRYWSFSGGLRTPASASSTATQVDDVGLAAYPEATSPPSGGGTPSPPRGNPGPGSPGPVGSPSGSGRTGSDTAPRCVVPRLRDKTLAKARRALAKAHCRLGKVRRPKHLQRSRVLHVAGQSARHGSKHHTGYRVNVVLR